MRHKPHRPKAKWNVVLESTRFFVWKTGLLPEND